MRVLIYVEGVSDRLALSALLESLIEDGRQRHAGVQFLPEGSKDGILNRVPKKAALHLRDKPDDWVIALPDLHPMSSYQGTPNQHATLAELRALLAGKFAEHADELGLGAEVRRHFRVHCLKHDLEALILAAPDALRKRLGTKEQLRDAWRRPVETQNDARPPKRVVEELFDKYRKKTRYIETVDAPSILGQASLDEIEKACRECFAPFVAELRATVLHGGEGLG